MTPRHGLQVISGAIERRIHIIRAGKVMLDSDLAVLYGVSAKRLNEQVKRNRRRFPRDFMFRLTPGETRSLRSQIATFQSRVRSDSAVDGAQCTDCKATNRVSDKPQPPYVRGFAGSAKDVRCAPDGCAILSGARVAYATFRCGVHAKTAALAPLT